jgi:chitin synthase
MSTPGYGRPHEEHDTNPFIDHRQPSPSGYHSPSPSPGPHQGYQLQDRPFAHDQPLHIPVGPGPYAAQSGDQLAAQPTYDVTGMPSSYGHGQHYDDVHAHGHTPVPYQGRTEYNLSPHPAMSPDDRHEGYFHDPNYDAPQHP